MDSSFLCPVSPTGPFSPQVLIHHLTAETGDAMEQKENQERFGEGYTLQLHSRR